MLWLFPAVFALLGLLLAFFPRAAMFWFAVTYNRPATLSSLRWMGLMFLLTAAVFVVLIATGTIE